MVGRNKLKPEHIIGQLESNRCVMPQQDQSRLVRQSSTEVDFGSSDALSRSFSTPPSTRLSQLAPKTRKTAYILGIYPSSNRSADYGIPCPSFHPVNNYTVGGSIPIHSPVSHCIATRLSPVKFPFPIIRSLSQELSSK
jgi:hypothetical protein